jgi:hypothetical protein
MESRHALSFFGEALPFSTRPVAGFLLEFVTFSFQFQDKLDSVSFPGHLF